MHKYLGKCAKPPLDNGVFSDTKLSYKIRERLQYACNPGYQTPEGSKEEMIQCLQDGWSAQPRCIEATGMAFDNPQPHPETGHKTGGYW